MSALAEAQQRIEHLEFCIREMTAPATDTYGLPPLLSRMFGLMVTANGRAVSVSALMAAAYVDRADGDWPEEHIVAVHVHHMRKRLARANAPWTIRNVWGVGYKAERKA